MIFQNLQKKRYKKNTFIYDGITNKPKSLSKLFIFMQSAESRNVKGWIRTKTKFCCSKVENQKYGRSNKNYIFFSSYLNLS